MDEDVIKRLFPGALERIKNGLCPICKQPIHLEDFRELIDVHEFVISGMCQACQDKAFTNDEQDD